MANRIPNVKKLLPPWLNNGSGIPTTGANLMVIKIFTDKWINIKNPSEALNTCKILSFLYK